MELHPIKPDIYADFVRCLFSEYNRTVMYDDIQKVYSLFEGNTYYMQRTFHEAFINTLEGGDCTLQLLRQTIDAMLEAECDGYRLLLSRIPERQKELLYAITSEGRANKIMSAPFIRKYSLASASAVQAAARKLMEYDLLTVEDGTYFIPDILLRMYLLRLRNSNIKFI